MKKILIIGGTGFIGFNIAKKLQKKSNYVIHIADNLSRGQLDNYILDLISHKNVKFIEGDFTLSSSFNLLDNNYDYVYMLASIVGVNNTLEKPDQIIRVNSLLVIQTLDWIKKSSVKKVVYTSTSENYAGTIDTFGFTIPTPETIPLTISEISHPRFTYAVTKILGESAFLNYSKIYDFEACIIRYHNVYGPRMGFKHVIPHLAERFISNESPFKIYGAEQTRAFCFIDDAVEGTILAMENDKTNDEIIHIGTQEEITIDELVRESGNFFGYKGKYTNEKTFPGSTKRRCPDISKARDYINYNPKVSWKDGLKITLSWYRDFFENKNEIFETSFKKPF
tara:strand:- start:157 stop:1170 length:1014 start_codon:yes stop_codon:yes gene_type:complete